MKKGRNKTAKKSISHNDYLESQGPFGVKVKGNLKQVYNRYLQYIEESASLSDTLRGRIFAEHAEHYRRLINLLEPKKPSQRKSSVEGSVKTNSDQSQQKK